MTDDPLGPELRELIAAGRDRLGPDAATVARLRTRIDSAIAAGPALALRLLATKLVVIAALGVVGAGLYLAGRQAHPASVAPVLAVTAEEVPLSPRVALSARDSVTPSRSGEDAHARPTSEPTRTAAVVQPNQTSTRADASPAIPSPEIATGVSLAREIELIDRSTVLMRQGHATSALETLGGYDRETAGHGQLAQDAAALRVEILCMTNDARAADQLARFDRRWPQSAQARRLGALCETSISKR